MKKISAKIIADSYNPHLDVRITTYELEYPRFIHSEFMTHRVFSRNAASSRAIPVATMIDLIADDPAKPIHWGKNQPGMQAKEELEEPNLIRVKSLWQQSCDDAVGNAIRMNREGAHKQIVNRILEPYQWMKTVMTTTKTRNWDWLRNHDDAQPEIKELAGCMEEASNLSNPVWLQADQWHLPYVDTVTRGTKQEYFDESGNEIHLSEALMISASCCAQVSYRKQDPSLEKAGNIYDRLINSEPVHASPIEHQATPIYQPVEYIGDYFLIPGITHVDRYGMPHSGNFHGWIQHRQLIPNHCREY